MTQTAFQKNGIESLGFNSDEGLFIPWYDVASQGCKCLAFWDQKFFKVYNKW